MKNYIFISLLLILASLFCGIDNLYPQNFLIEKKDTLVLTVEDELKYENAYNAIKMDYSKDCAFIVHPKLTSTNFTFFLEELNIEYDLALRLDEVENNTCLFWKDEDSIVQRKNKYVIGFSELIAGKELFCCVYDVRFYNTSMGDITYYYFSFDENGDIKKMHKKLMHGL